MWVKLTVCVPAARWTHASPQLSAGLPAIRICDGNAGDVVTRNIPPVGPAVAVLVAKVPVIVVRAPAVTVAVWNAGVACPGTAPKHTWWDPVGMSVHMPQSSRAMPSTLMVEGTAG